MSEKIGIDIGGVLASEERGRLYFTMDQFMQTPEVPGAFVGVQTLVEQRFGEENTYIISKLSEPGEVISRAWMDHTKFFERTGVNPEHLIYCRRREDKAPIAESLGLSHFVDNNPEVLKHFQNGESLLLFQPKMIELEKHAEHLGRMTIVNSWEEILNTL